MSTLYLVHCVDTEGPLSERAPSLQQSANDRSTPSSLPAAGRDFSKDLSSVIRQHRSRFLGSWSEVVSMLREVTSVEERNRMTDSFGGGWIFNWFCMDHVGYIDNPRHRAMGMHVIFDFYRNLVAEQEAGDGIHWHFHPMSTYGEAHRCATSYLNSPLLREILGRRILDRHWFPRANRAGFQDERPDSHWFLEQWIPFDFSNTATNDEAEEGSAPAWWNSGRFSDWRWAPSDWRTYHPDHDCHQREGRCRRKIARCLNLLNNFANLDERELTAAFGRAAGGEPTLVAFASHDWRDMRLEVGYLQHLLRKIAPEFPAVKFKFAEAVEAFNAVHSPTEEPRLAFDCKLLLDDRGLPARINVSVPEGKIFGPQPFLAIRTRSRRIIHDNMNYGTSLDDFFYAFDEESVLPDDVKTIGLAANDAAGNQSIHVVDLDEVEAAPSREISF